ncbi:MAG: hypothetical protein R3B09_07180 [Nannocystaceae bacterium]
MKITPIGRVGRGALQLGAALALTVGCPPAGEGTSASAGSTTEATTSAATTDETSSGTTFVTFGTTATTTTLSTTYATTAATTAGGSTVSTASDTDTDTGAPVECVVSPMEHLEACPGEPCPIVEDVEIRCDDDEVAAPGIRVAPTADETWLVTASSHARIFIRVVDGEGGLFEALPEAFDRETILLAAGPEGAVHAAADVTQPPTYDGGLVHVADPGRWAPTTVYDTTKYIPILDLEVALDGVPHLWFIGDAPDQKNLATRVDEVEWSVGPAPLPSGVEWTHYTLTSAGAPVGAGFHEAGSGWQLWTLVDGVEAMLGAQVDDLFPHGYRLTPAPVPLAPPGPPYAVAIQHLDGIRVVWPEGDPYTEVAIAGSESLLTLCDGTWDDGCPAPCHELGGGLEDGAMALARGSDGVVWLVYVRTQLDYEVTYSEECTKNQGCYCKTKVGADVGAATLQVVRVPVDGAPPTLALSQPIADPALFDLFSGWQDTPRGVDARAFGDHLAVAIRTMDGPGGPYAVRMLRIDTSMLP